MSLFKKNLSPEEHLAQAIKKTGKGKDEIFTDIQMLKQEYGIGESTYFNDRYYLLSQAAMCEKADQLRQEDFWAAKAAEAADISKDAVLQKLRTARKMGVSPKEFFEGEYFISDNLKERKKQLQIAEKKEQLSDQEIQTIMESCGWSRSEVYDALASARENFGIGARTYFRNKYYTRAETVMARLNSQRLKKNASYRRIYDTIEKESGKTEKQVRQQIKELNAANPGLNLALGSYYEFSFHKLPEEGQADVIETVIRLNEIKSSNEIIDSATAEEYKELLGKVLSRQRKRQLFSLIKGTLPDLKRKDPKTEDLLVDMQMTKDLLGFSVSEYTAYKFWEKDIDERQTYVSNKYKGDKLKQVNTLAGRSIADSKYAVYRILKPYYHREAVLIDRENGYETFKDFCSRHSQFVKKSNYDSMGVGIQKITIDENTVLRNLFDEITQKGKRVLLEELIEVHPDIKFLNPDSVNTVRMTSFRDYNDEVTIQDCSMRIGRKDSFVDNAGAGGILVHIDKETGKFDTSGVDKTGARYETHPEHGYTFKGYQLPDWEQLLQTVRELADKIDGLRYIGWDLTYTKEGYWVVVECNGITQFFGQQATVQRGRKADLLAAIEPTIEHLSKE